MGTDSGVGRLLGGVKKLKIDDQDSSTASRLNDAFPKHWHSAQSTNSGGQHNKSIVIYSQTNLTEDRILCGLSNGQICFVDPNKPSLPLNTNKRGQNSTNVFSRFHKGLSCIACSKTNPELVYSGSAKDGTIALYDFRTPCDQPTQIFSVGSSKIGGNIEVGPSAPTATTTTLRPILSLDISPGDQVLCGGTELVGEDSFILFWDVRAVGGSFKNSLLGAYWESHSDDVTTCRFHPDKFNLLVTGSTDGLLNVFDLLQSSEDDALQFSLNTSSSVDSVYWNQNVENLPNSCLTCITHTNHVQIWDAESGDKFTEFSRKMISDAMMRSNPSAAYVNRCYSTQGRKSSGSPLGLLTCSLKGSCTRFISIKGDKLEPEGLFIGHNSVVQTAEFISSANKWVTFDDEGFIRTWTLDAGTNNDAPTTSTKLSKTEIDNYTETDLGAGHNKEVVKKHRKEMKAKSKPYVRQK